MKVLAIDPGERTGWAIGEIEDSKLTIVNQGVTPLKDFALKFHEVAGDYDVVVYEWWRLRADVAKKMIGNDFLPSQLIGMIRLSAWLNPKVKLVSYGPQVKTTAIKVAPDWLKERKALSSEEHDKDALDLLYYYFWENFVT